MKKFFLRAKRPFVWIGRNAAIFTAISSILIAAASLYYTIDAQRTDREYKEVAIQPRLWLGGEPENFGLTLKNTGLGPAIVGTIVIRVGGQCKSSDDYAPDEWINIFSSFVTELVDPLYTKTLPKLPAPKGQAAKFNVQSNILTVGDSLRPGDKYPIIYLDRDTMDGLSQVDSTERVQAEHKFAAAAYDVPMRILLCSATGRTCRVIGKTKDCPR